LFTVFSIILISLSKILSFQQRNSMNNNYKLNSTFRKYAITGLLLILASACAVKTRNIDLKEGKDIIVSHGMVVSAHPEASRIGNEILRKGGNAIDAAIATEFALAVCYPEAGNIGGGGFMVIRTADGRSDVIDYREKAPALSSRDMFLDDKGNVTEGRSTSTHLASGVPGTVDGMFIAHSKYGSISFRDLIQPAIDLAVHGFPITAGQAAGLNSNKQAFIERNVSSTAFVKDFQWKEGDTLIQKDLAHTLERIRDNGREGFYSGKTAELIVNEMKRGNGLISYKDLSDYKSSSRQPLVANYRGYRIITVPPPSSGGIILIQLLGMIEPYPVGTWGFNSFKTIHLMTEAERRAFADRAEYMGDPQFMKVSTEDLTNKTYIASRMNTFNENKASLSSQVKPGIPGKIDGQTTHYSVADEKGNTVSATTTLNGSFGSSIVVEGAGFLLNNQMDDFSVKPGFPNMYGLSGGEANAISPGKKMLSSMTPVIVEKGGKPFLVAGSPGGSTIPTTVFQIIVNVTDHNMKISDAVNAPRFHHQWLPDILYYEHDRIDSGTAEMLEKMGHNLEQRGRIGSVNAIMIAPDGTKSGSADKRGDNVACGY
jgi:gamma-glutamyltranspeptidase/glutathione hydrolase